MPKFEKEKTEIQETLVSWLGTDLEMMNIRLNKEQSNFVLGSMSELIENMIEHILKLDKMAKKEPDMAKVLEHVYQLLRLNALQLSTSIYWKDKAQIISEG